MVSCVPLAAGCSSYVQLPPNGSDLSVIRVTRRCCGTLSTVSKVMVPSPDTSRQTGPAAPCRMTSTDLTSALHCGAEDTSVIVAHTRSGGAASCADRVATCLTGSEYPTATTITTRAARDPRTINSQRMTPPLNGNRQPSWGLLTIVRHPCSQP